MQFGLPIVSLIEDLEEKNLFYEDKITQSDPLNYLSRLPEEARYLGDHTKGEIEIVTDSQAIAEIVETYREKLQSLNLNSDVASVGVLLEDDHILVIRDPVKFPSGQTSTYFRVLQRPGLDGPLGVVMLPFCDGLIYLRKIFRHATRRWELECPKGYKQKDFSLAETAKNEISEELGLEVKDIRDIGSLASDTGLSAGIIQAYWVVLEGGKPHPSPEEGEAFGPIVAIAPHEIMEKIRAGEIRDGVTLSVLQLAQAQNLLPLDKD